MTSTFTRPNPYTDAINAWGYVIIGNFTVPGIVQSIDGHTKPEEWSFAKGTGSSGATSTWKGSKLAESIKIVTRLTSAEEFDLYYDLRDTLRPQPGKKPPSLTILHPAINFSGITQVACIDVLPPTWVDGGGYWQGEVQVCEFNPSKPTNTGPAGAAKPDPKGAPDPNEDVKKALQAELDKAAKS